MPINEKKGVNGKKSYSHQPLYSPQLTKTNYGPQLLAWKHGITHEYLQPYGCRKKNVKEVKSDADTSAMSEVSSNVWQGRLEVTDQTRIEYREHARKLALDNESLHNQIVVAEQDNMDVVSFLRSDSEEKDKQIVKLVTEMQELQKQHAREKEKLFSEFQQQFGEIDNQLTQRTRELEIVRSELKLFKEFRHKRSEMQKELNEIKAALSEATQEHTDIVAKMERRYFEEKLKLQQEASRKLSELADKARTEAVANLDETSKNIFKENVRMTQSLTYYMEESEQLRKRVAKLADENERLKGDRELNELLVQNKVSQSQKNKQTIKELREKVLTLEKSLDHTIKEFENEQGLMIAKTSSETELSRAEVLKLQRILELKTKEMNKVKKLARNILEQRTETEKFFLEALSDVKKEIAAHRIQYRRAAEAAYQRKLLDACMGKAEFPKVRTFNKTDASTNSVYHDMQSAASGETLAGGGRIDIGELTWEQKEKVLRYLFARMNRTVSAPPVVHSQQPAASPSPAQLPSIANHSAWAEHTEDVASEGAFLTEASISNIGRLPGTNLIGAQYPWQ